MATQTVEFQAASGQTITAKLFTPGSDTEVASASATERTNDKGTYRVDYTDVAAGTYRLKGLVSSTAVCAWRVDLTLATATFYTREPATVEKMSDDVITRDAHDESTAHPLRSADTGSTQVARVGADGDTLETLSDQLDAISALATGFVINTTTIATLTNQTTFTLTAGSADDDAYNDMQIMFVDASTSTQRWVSYITDYTGASKTVRLLAAPGFTIAATDSVYILSGQESVNVRVEAALTSSAGTTCHVSAWLDWRGQRIDISGATCSIVFRKLDADTNLFTVTESDLLGTSAIYENVFRLVKSSPGFTDDRTYVVTATITHNGRAFSGTALIPCLAAT